MEGKAWYNLDVAEVVSSLDSNVEGLTADEAKKRLAQYGPNELREEEDIRLVVGCRAIQEYLNYYPYGGGSCFSWSGHSQL